MEKNNDQESRYLKSPYSIDDTRGENQSLIFGNYIEGGNFLFKDSFIYPGEALYKDIISGT